MIVSSEPDLTRYEHDVTEILEDAILERSELGLYTSPTVRAQVSTYPLKNALAVATRGGDVGELAISVLGFIHEENQASAQLMQHLNVLYDKLQRGEEELWKLIQNPDEWYATHMHNGRLHDPHLDARNARLKITRQSPEDVRDEAHRRREEILSLYEAAISNLPERLSGPLHVTLRHELEHCAHLHGPLHESWQTEIHDGALAQHRFHYEQSISAEELADARRQASIAHAERTAVYESRAMAFTLLQPRQFDRINIERLGLALCDIITRGYTRDIATYALDAAVSTSWAKGTMNQDTSLAIHAQVAQELGIHYSGRWNEESVRDKTVTAVLNEFEKKKRVWGTIVHHAAYATATAFAEDPQRLNDATYAENFSQYVARCKGS